MDLGFSKKEILSLFDQYLEDINEQFEEQIKKIKENDEEPTVGLAALLSSSMLSMLDSISSVVEINNQKITEDLKKAGLIK